jgi:hypothetical protein
MRSFIRTVRTEALTSIVERGAMFWEAAELGASSWFVVEVCSVDDKAVERWITPSIRKAVQLQKGRTPSSWSRITACLHVPENVRSAPIFQEVTAAYQIGTGDSYLLRFADGMSFSTQETEPDATQTGPKQVMAFYETSTHPIAVAKK